MPDVPDQDDRLAALFREAAGDPPPGFDHRAVVARSRRVTARRRAAVLGSAAALVVVLGTGIVVDGQAQDEAASTAAAPAAGGAAEAAPEGGAAERDGDTASADPFAAQPASPGPLGPLGPAPAPCADPALRALVERALPEVVGAPDAAVGDGCPFGAREVALQVVDGTASGRLTVVALPPGEPALQPLDAAVATAPTASGGTVVVRSEGDGPGALAPFAGRLDAVAAALAPSL